MEAKREGREGGSREKKKRREESGPRGPDGDGWVLGFGLGLSFFQTLLKPTFKHFLNQTFYTNFSKIFTIIFKAFSQTFKATKQQKPMHST
jgi:hypothetical protein